MAWSAWMSALNDALADLYPTFQESRRIVSAAGVRPALVKFSDQALLNWFNILEEARRQSPNHADPRPEKVEKILAAALADYPENDLLRALERDEPAPVRGTDIRKDVDWSPDEDMEHLEKIIGEQSTLLPIRFLEIGTERARSVARIVRADRMSGTGFLIGSGLILTNHHVLPTKEIAAAAIAEFNYQETAAGLSAEVEKHQIDATRFATSKENDWSVAGVADAVEKRWGTIPLEPAETRAGAFVNIVQHPGGGPKQIGLYHNTVAYAGKERVQYLTDTLPGSSGSPVFDDQWRIVALHHSGGMLREPGTKKSYYRNEGIAIAAVIDDLRAAGIQIG